MKALVTVEDGRMFQINGHAHVVTLMNPLGKTIATRNFERAPIAMPGSPFTFTSSDDGVETNGGTVVNVIYSQ